jgi:hypothetical protein
MAADGYVHPDRPDWEEAAAVDGQERGAGVWRALALRWVGHFDRVVEALVGVSEEEVAEMD